jgi:hypothetical protein
MENRRSFVLASVALALVLLTLLILAQGMAASSPGPSLTPGDVRSMQPANPLWHSTWTEITPGDCRVFNHELGGDPNDYVVEVWFRDTDAGGLGMNRRGYGGLDANGQRLGAHWELLTTDTIAVCRGDDDTAADEVSVRVWEPDTEPDYVSPWTDIDPGETLMFTHSLNITETELTVSLWFSGTERGIHNLGYGGLAIDDLEQMRGAHWEHLTANSVQVTRHPDDPVVEQVRMLVVHAVPPAYDSLEEHGGWQPIAPGTAFTFDHDLSWAPYLMLVRGECYSPERGIHQLFAGGNHDWFVGWQGANVEKLTNNTVDVFRQPDDEICPLVRVRIWTRGRRVYMPLVLYDAP